MGKFDQVLEKAKADGLIRPLEREKKVGKPSSTGKSKQTDERAEPLPLSNDEEKSPVTMDVPVERPEQKRAFVRTRGISEPEMQDSISIPTAENQGRGPEVRSPRREERGLGVRGEGKKEETQERTSIEDRQTIAQSLDSLRAAAGKGLSGDGAKEFIFRKGKSAKHAVTLLKPSSAFAEYFRVIRTRVLYAAKERKARVIFLTSTVPKEGKSFIASNLALSMANGLDRPVLLIDADFRKPSLHTTFGFGATRGLSDFLADQSCQLSSVIQGTSFPRLSVLPAGSCPEGSTELLASDVMKVFVEHVKYEDEERYVILDGPPSEISETLALSKLADGTVLVVRAGYGDKRRTKRTVDGIGANNILGIVLNHTSLKMNDYYHYYKKTK